MRWAIRIGGLGLAALIYHFSSAGCSNTVTPQCQHDAGETCLCSATDTVKNCTDAHGQPGIEYCEAGIWSDCAAFLDGGFGD